MYQNGQQSISFLRPVGGQDPSPPSLGPRPFKNPVSITETYKMRYTILRM